jgi:hypothetical protein
MFESISEDNLHKIYIVRQTALIGVLTQRKYEISCQNKILTG